MRVLSAAIVIALALTGCSGAPSASTTSAKAPVAQATTVAPQASTVAPAASTASTSAAKATSAGTSTPPASEPSGPVANRVPTLYQQFDAPWADQVYGTTDKDTVRRWGCGPADMAMVVSTLKDPLVTPAIASAWSLRKGYFTDEPGKTKDGFFEAFGVQYGVRVTQVNQGDLRTMPADQAKLYKEQARQAVRNGDWVIALMGKGPWTTEGHYVLWYDAPGDEVLIRDSNSKKPEKLRNTYDTFQATMVRLWVVDVQP